MVGERIFRLSKGTILSIAFRMIFYIAFLLIDFFFIYIVVSADPIEGNSRIAAIIAVLLMTGFMLYRFVPDIVLYLQYLKNEWGRAITFDTDTKQIILLHNGRSETISAHDIREIRYQSLPNISNTRNNGLSFVKITTNTGKTFFLTSLVIEENEVREFFYDVQSSFFSGRLNWLR